MIEKIITSLTKEQKTIHDQYKSRWLAHGISTDRADRPRAERAIAALYTIAGYKPVRFLWCESPLDAKCKYKILKTPYFFGQQDSYWIAFYLFCRDVLKVEYDKRCSKILDLHAEVAQSCCWWWPFENAVIVCERPVECHIENGVLHRDGGAAIIFSDGFCSWNLHGIRVSQEIAETPAEKLDPRLLLKERNADVRREIVRKIGIERICQKLNSSIIDKQGDYELLLLDLGDSRRRPYLKMRNPSIGIFHIEGVPEQIKTVAEALAWRNGTPDAPIALT